MASPAAIKPHILCASNLVSVAAEITERGGDGAVCADSK